MQNKHQQLGDSIEAILHKISHYLPSQSPLKDFVYYNTLEAFQNENFHSALNKASSNFGYKVYLSINEYRKAFYSNKIDKMILDKFIIDLKGEEQLDNWKEKLLNKPFDETLHQKIGSLRKYWKDDYKINLNKYTHPILFRTISNFLDQGISISKFPYRNLSFIEALREIEKNSFISIFKTERAKNLLLNEHQLLEKLLEIVVGNQELIEHYLFDQQFAHPGWSGMVSVVEKQPSTLLDKRSISLLELVCFELLLEIDALDLKFGEIWKPISDSIPFNFDKNVFSKQATNELFEVYKIWQNAYEWTYYDEVVKGLQITNQKQNPKNKTFQAVFCIDDRECSFRRHLESNDTNCETFSTAGFFNVAFYFQPQHSNFFTKVCPAPQFPSHLIKEFDASKRHKKDSHFNKNTYGFLGGIITAPTMGLWSALKMAKSILYPTQTEALVSSFNHMDRNGKLLIEATPDQDKMGDLQLGFTTSEMVDKIEGLLKGIGLTIDFAPLVYFIGHGASSVNNPLYAGYDCGACSGRAGSVNARVAAYIANKPIVRKELEKRGIQIPDTTQFIGGLHDTTRDEVEFYDETILNVQNSKLHQINTKIILKSLSENAKERSRRFYLMNSNNEAKKIHKKVKLRSISLFEPRSEWDHATNTLCLIGKRANNKHLFFDRRAFLNSYDYSIDFDGTILLGILNAVVPVCGGINLEYYFSRIDNNRLGAGSKLPHNIMGLIGVANGMDGDLRTGLPKQAVDIHEPMRLLITIEHFPDEVLRIIKLNAKTYEWFMNEWIHLVVIHPIDKKLYVFKNEQFLDYVPITNEIKQVSNLKKLFETETDSLPVYQIA